MKIIKKYNQLFFFFLLMFALINIVAPCARADSLWDLAQEGGIEEIGETAFGQAGEPMDIRSYVAIVINVFLTLLAIIFLVIVIIGGYTWMTAAGNEDKVKDAKAKIRMGIIGLLIILISWSITKFIICQILTEILETTWPVC